MSSEDWGLVDYSVMEFPMDKDFKMTDDDKQKKIKQLKKRILNLQNELKKLEHYE